jgi:hypothetical protein
MSQNIRIRTTPLGTDNYLKVKLEQDFDFIEILSLKISQDNVYQNFCSDYGVIVGRVTANNGFGVPNAKVSVFIPIDDIDKDDPKIRGMYPYETVTSKDSDGIRYNLLPKESDSQDDCYTPVGTFPAKREVLDNEDVSYVFCKYYKYTSVTNSAGDFMIFGVPLGTYTVHVDADISNIGVASQRPYDFIEQGTPNKSFYSPTKFKESKNLNTLIQIKTANVGVNVQPFWGNTEECEIGINRVDIDLNFNIRPSAFFLGSYFGDSRKNSYNKNCRPRKLMGSLCNQITGEGTIDMLRKTPENQIERFDIEGGRLIDDKGTWAYMIPCNLDYVVTDEFGNLIPSEDENKGIPTRARVRFRISMDETGGLGRLRTRGKYLVPHNPKNINELDFTFDKNTKDLHFRDFYWNKIYTVRNFIARTEKGGAGRKTKNFSGIKDVDGCVGDKEPMPFNRTYTKGNILFTIICFLVNLIAFIVYPINAFLCWLRGVGINTRVIKWYPFRNVKAVTISCPTEPAKYFQPGCNGESTEPYTDCVSAVLAEGFNMFTFDFYNDWINGTLYYYLLKYKKKRRSKREKFCEYYCDDYPNKEATGRNNCYNNTLTDSTYDEEKQTISKGIRNGMLVRYEGNLYYPPIALDGSNWKMYATEITNLGSIFDCDWQGIPKIIQYLPSSSFKIPPLTMEEDTDNNEYVSGMINLRQSPFVGIFYDISCGGLKLGAGYAKNIRRLCELQVDIPDSIGLPPPYYVSIRDIYDMNDPVDSVTSINRYIRDSYTLLNISGPSISSFPPAGFPILSQLTNPSVGTSFNINQGFNSSNNGSTYNQFRGGQVSLNGDSYFQMWGNSYFLYFGVIPGASALDKFKSKYLTPCDKFNTGDFIIDTTIDCTSTNSSSDGKITFDFLGGKAPYIYTLTNNTTVDIGPLTSTTGNAIVDSLGEGTYTIVVTDSLGITNVKDVEMCKPLGLNCNFYLAKENTCLNTPNGEVQYFIIGGKEPYNITYTSNAGAIGDLGSSPSGLKTELAGGDYTFTVIDADGTTCTKQITVTEPSPLNIDLGDEDEGYQYVTCTEVNDAFIRPTISGGEPPYYIQVTRPANIYDNSPYDSGVREYIISQFNDLYPGDYTITATDSTRCTTVTKELKIFKYIPPVMNLNAPINNKKQCDPTKYTIQFNVVQTSLSNEYQKPTPPPFDLDIEIDGNVLTQMSLSNYGLQTITIIPQINSLLRLLIQDSRGCTAELSIPEPTIHRPNVQLTLTGVRNVTYVPNPTPPFIPSTIPVPFGVITWNATHDDYSSFLPLQYSPIDPIPPLMQFNNTWSATTWDSVIGTVTNNVGCTNAFSVPPGP